MFITFDRSINPWNKSNNIYCVSRLISIDSKLKPASTPAVNKLMMRCEFSCKSLSIKKLKTGAQIKILKGPFANFIATVINTKLIIKYGF